MTSGIYTITNKIDEKIYVGYTLDFSARFRLHINKLRNNIHPNNHLQSSFNKYGEENFIFEVLEECEERFLASQEHYWCNMLNVHNDKFGYNIKYTNPYGKPRHNQETINKIAKRSQMEDNRLRLRGLQLIESKKRIGTHKSKEEKLRCIKTRCGITRVIDIFDIKGNLVNSVDLIQEASTMTNTKISNIKNNLYGLSRSANNNIFKFREVVNG